LHPIIKLNQIVDSESLCQDILLAKEFMDESHAPSTRKGYRSDWRIFCRWCEQRGVEPFPAEPGIIAAFISSQARDGAKVATIEHRLTSIRFYHARSGIDPQPTAADVVNTTMRGIRRRLGVAQNKSTPITSDLLVKIVRRIPKGISGRRDRALLLLGFAGAFRRSELVALNLEDIEWVRQGIRVHIRKSKTDQEGAGQVVPIIRGKKACPVKALRSWVKAARINEGPIFRRIAKGGKILDQAITPHSVGLIIKDRLDIAGFDSREFSGHSLRSGFLTSAAMNGANLFKMMDISRHKSLNSLLGYVRMADEFKNHAGDGLL
jgi:site-specific recombinase XerD